MVDNYGDIGTCWRLARQLAAEHHAQVRLWVDDLASFARMCPSVSASTSRQQIGEIEVCHWETDFSNVDPADVVIEAFACHLPDSYVQAMAAKKVAPVWINLEYLSAETWVEDCHVLPSPHPKLPLTKYFFFPGFTQKTGGLLRERDLFIERDSFDSNDRKMLLNRLNTAVAEGLKTKYRESSNLVDPESNMYTSANRSEPGTHISLFCYENSALVPLLESWAEGPEAIRVYVSPGAAAEQVSRWQGIEITPGDSFHHGSLTMQAIPFLLQPDYDRLLWSCDINFVRGEDSFVRAQWAERPFVWQIYPQAENTHFVKLDAFLDRYLADFRPADVVRSFWKAWNGMGDIRSTWKNFAAIQKSLLEHGKAWSGHLDRTGNLADNLVRFVRGK